MCLGAAVVPPNPKAHFYAQALRMLLFVQVAVVVLNFIAATSFLREAILGIFFFFVLYIAQHQLSFQAIMAFIFISIYYAVYFMVYFLTPLQKEINIPALSNMEKFCYADAVFSFTYYTFCAVFCFFPYREFKTLEYNANPALRNYFNQKQVPEKNDDSESEQPPKVANYEVNYGELIHVQQRRSNEEGTFEVFKGQGVTIG